MKFLVNIPLHSQLAMLKKMKFDAIYDSRIAELDSTINLSADTSNLVNVSKKTVTITANYGVNSFYVRSASAYTEFHEMQTLLCCIPADQLQDFRFFPLPKIGERCLYMEGDNRFYRASIENITAKKRSSDFDIRIVLIDMGRKIDINTVTERGLVKRLPYRFACYPPLVRQFELYGMDSAEHSRWDTDNCRSDLDFIFHMLTKDKNLELEVKETGE